MDSHQVEEECAVIRERAHTAVSENRITIDPMWNREALGYNIHVLFDRPVAEAFAAVQQTLLALEPEALNVCPPETLHISVAWVLATLKTYPRDKDVLWQDIKDRSISELRSICSVIPPFKLVFRYLIATDSAVIAVAVDDGSVASIREQIATGLPIPPETKNNARIIHTTLFRYRSTLRDPHRFLSAVDSLKIEILMTVQQLFVRKETVYPSLQSEVEATVPLGK
ncbi:hypothetical protein KGQ71_02700 [Patescibacteria group bacterium]|nr:hypothetical protein [Patescibacteria group bacterium]